MIRLLNRLWMTWHMRRLSADLQATIFASQALDVKIDQLIRDGAELQRRLLVADVPALGKKS